MIETEGIVCIYDNPTRARLAQERQNYICDDSNVLFSRRIISIRCVNIRAHVYTHTYTHTRLPFSAIVARKGNWIVDA